MIQVSACQAQTLDFPGADEAQKLVHPRQECPPSIRLPLFQITTWERKVPTAPKNLAIWSLILQHQKLKKPGI